MNTRTVLNDPLPAGAPPGAHREGELAEGPADRRNWEQSGSAAPDRAERAEREEVNEVPERLSRRCA